MSNETKNTCCSDGRYVSIQQAYKKEPGEDKRKPVSFTTPIQAVYDGKTGARLEAILAQFNAIYVQYQGTPEATRNIIPEVMRRAGLTITYMDMESNTITERASSAVQKDNDHWGLDVNWSRVDELSLSGDVSVSANGTWIINGEDTGVKALGPKGDTGLTPWLKTIDNKLHFSYDNATWEPCSENIAAWFRFSASSSDSQAGTIGRIQISRDNKTWTDLSPEFRNYLRIQGYVATTSALPANQAVGTIYGVGPTYAADDTAHTNPIYRLHVWNGTSWVDNGQFTSIAAGVVQEMGDSETEVMSQKAVSEKLSELGQEVDGLEHNIRPIIEGFSYKLEVTEIYGEYVSKGSYIAYSDNFARTNQFDVPPHKTIVIAARGYLTNVCMIARYNSDGTYTALVNSIDNNERVYSYVNDTEETIQVVCSFSTSFKRTIRITNIVSQDDLNAALYGNQLSQKMSIVANEDDSALQKGLLSFDMFVEDEYADEAKYLYTVTRIGYYAANNFVGIQGYLTNLTTNAKYQFTFRVDTANEQPTGIRTYKVKDFGYAKAVEHSGEDIALNYVLSISIDFDIIVGFVILYSKVKPYKYSSFAKSYATIEEVENNFIGTKQLAYPYEFGECNTIYDGIVAGLNQGINKSIINNINGNSIEEKALRLEITQTTTSNWSYYWTKDYGIKTKGKYLAFIKIKRNASSPIEFIVFTTGGSILGRKDISNSLSSEYQMFYIDFELVEDKKVMVGIAYYKAGDNAVIGEYIEVSLLGLARERTETSLGSDIYTADDYKKYYIQSMYGKMSNIEEIATMAIFEGIPVVGIIGDSLASGVTYNGTEMITDYSKAWWRVLERDSGQKYIPFARGGLTTRSWLTDYLQDALKAENKCCVYIIGLQVNDAYALGDDYLGTSADIDTADYNNNADTYYGNYAKIIQALTENNPKCKFFLLTEPRKTDEKDSNWNGAVRHIASLFDNCFLVDMQDMYNSLYLNGFIKNTMSNDAHYPSIAYSYMGKLIEKAIGETIKNNVDSFKYIQFALE